MIRYLKLRLFTWHILTGLLVAVLAQTAGAQFVSPANRTYGSLVPTNDAKPLVPLLDQPLTDGSITLGPDKSYYLTGSAVENDAGIFSSTITLWKSPDMKTWTTIRELVLSDTKALSPEIHYLKGEFWLTYSREGGGADLIHFDTADLAASPFEVAHVTPQGEDPSLFLDDDGRLYWIMGSGQVARMKDDPMQGLDEALVQITIPPMNSPLQKDPSALVGKHGAFMAKIKGRYCLFATDRPMFNGWGRAGTPGGADDTYVSSSDNIYRGYGHRYIAFPYAGQTTLFVDANAKLWATFSGQDTHAIFRCQVGAFPVEVVAVPKTDIFPELMIRPGTSFIYEGGPIGALRPAKIFTNATMGVPVPWVRDISICTAPDGYYYLTGTTGMNVQEKGIGGEDYIPLWRSKDLQTWDPVARIFQSGDDKTRWYRGSNEKAPALWAPEIHYINGTYWVPFCSTASPAGNGLLKSTTGKPEGPYETAFAENKALVRGDDPTLFQDTDGTVYYVWMDGKIRQFNTDMTRFVTEERKLKTQDGKDIGYEGVMMTKMGPWYVVACAAWNGDNRCQGTYDLMYGISKNIWGPYSNRRLAVPHAGHSSFFQDRTGRWYVTLWGNDRTAPFRTGVGVVPLDITSTDQDLIIKPAFPLLHALNSGIPGGLIESTGLPTNGANASQSAKPIDDRLQPVTP